MKNKAKERKLSKEVLLTEAQKLFSKHSYRGTSIGDLTQRLGVTRPAIYYYFKCKRDILSELHTRAFKELTKNFDEIEASELPTIEKLRRVLENHALVVANNAELVKIFFHDDQEIPEELREKIQAKRKSYTEKMIKFYDQGMQEGVFRKENPTIAVYLLLGACNWLCRWYADSGVIDSESIVRSLMELLRKGYEIEYSTKGLG
jgi:AcrR family transcriptional regulator